MFAASRLLLVFIWMLKELFKSDEYYQNVGIINYMPLRPLLVYYFFKIITKIVLLNEQYCATRRFKSIQSKPNYLSRLAIAVV